MSKRILVIEDYDLLLNLMKDLLEEIGGHSVATAADGRAAGRLIAQQAFDAVVLDIGLPGMPSGLQIAELAKARQCPILFITGRDPAEVDCANLVEPSSRLLRKPFAMNVLLSEVTALLENNARKIHKPKRSRAPAKR